MEHAIEASFKGYLLTGLAIPDGSMFASLLILRLPNGDQLTSGVLERFVNASEAKQHAVEYGIRQVEHYERVRSDLDDQSGSNAHE
ncbi:hypothetical protein AWB75_02143 [Caballeronia catudaia]|uniref:Uncharacterized protein n=1 Tax=Caballeronia catudaia TaxID=1777136 RepID=A0A158AGR4_9BURK|nr:hypothetical protein [Caballeronia catudaia]SAK56846.1 hypothetical protein AWB75_02143 [Caballeronia catudaia]